MIDAHVLIIYSLIVLGFVFIPGPATLLTVARATTSWTKTGIATGAGITAVFSAAQFDSAALVRKGRRPHLLCAGCTPCAARKVTWMGAARD